MPQHIYFYISSNLITKPVPVPWSLSVCKLLIVLILPNISWNTGWQAPQRSQGTCEAFRDFLTQCLLVFRFLPTTTTTKKKTEVQANMAEMVSLVTRWAQSSICTHSKEFTCVMGHVLNHPANGWESGPSSVPSPAGTVLCDWLCYWVLQPDGDETVGW